MVGDGSYLMMNSEIATSVMLGHKLTIVVLDNRGFGCINRLQRATGRRELQQPAARTPSTSSCRRSTSRPCGEPRSDGAQGRRPAGARGRRCARRAARRSHERHRDRHRSAGVRRTQAATGGTWRCPRCRPATRSARHGEPTRTRSRGSASTERIRNEAGAATDDPDRGQSHRLVERRHAGTRRRDAARDVPGGGQGDRLRGDGARQQVPARSGGAEGAALEPFGLACVSGWYSGPSCSTGTSTPR